MPLQPDATADARPRRWAGALLRLIGWRTEMLPPGTPKAVIIVYPHTSNWDFPLGLLARWECGWQVRWLGKHTIFKGPWGALLRRWGGIPVNRNAAQGLAESIVREFESSETMLLAMAPEGTRRYVDHWKSGFLRIARTAEVPIGLAYIDYARRVIGISAYIQPSGDDAADMARIAAAYTGVVAFKPARAGIIRLRS